MSAPLLNVMLTLVATFVYRIQANQANILCIPIKGQDWRRAKSIVIIEGTSYLESLKAIYVGCSLIVALESTIRTVMRFIFKRPHRHIPFLLCRYLLHHFRNFMKCLLAKPKCFLSVSIGRLQPRWVQNAHTLRTMLGEQEVGALIIHSQHGSKTQVDRFWQAWVKCHSKTG
ncbi:hypothetical protein BKA65DRAFT_494856 [Rhexocercosporidium sp. MPI-PUGE-AT-0058]|nr:hypothetical protein BKA65DRAFT_494856 [Rhexocercosporidium sp. MPI-PUGE-AT-0058]